VRTGLRPLCTPAVGTVAVAPRDRQGHTHARVRSGVYCRHAGGNATPQCWPMALSLHWFHVACPCFSFNNHSEGVFVVVGIVGLGCQVREVREVGCLA
jgi:hypothetical protein